MDNYTVKYEVFRVNPFIPLPLKGKPPQFALIPASFYREMLKHFKNKKHQPFSENGGVIKASIMNGDVTFGEGQAICSMSDKFDAQVGMELAFHRALIDTNKHVKQVNALMQARLSDLLSREGKHATP